MNVDLIKSSANHCDFNDNVVYNHDNSNGDDVQKIPFAFIAP